MYKPCTILYKPCYDRCHSVKVYDQSHLQWCDFEAATQAESGLSLYTLLYTIGKIQLHVLQMWRCIISAISRHPPRYFWREERHDATVALVMDLDFVFVTYVEGGTVSQSSHIHNAFIRAI